MFDCDVFVVVVVILDVVDDVVVDVVVAGIAAVAAVLVVAVGVLLLFGDGFYCDVVDHVAAAVFDITVLLLLLWL